LPGDSGLIIQAASNRFGLVENRGFTPPKYHTSTAAMSRQTPPAMQAFIGMNFAFSGRQ
jgi:hypothetical protein